MTDRLCDATLAQLPASVDGPGFDRASSGIGIVHLGPGAFHRAHQAVFTNDAMAASGGDWGITAVSMRSTGVRDALREQDGLYTLEIHDAEISYRVIGSIREVLVLGDEYDAVMARLVDARTHIVTLTITEHGYCLGSDGRLDLDNPGIQQDLVGDSHPVSAIGLLVEALRRRRATSVAPFTAISCDNLADNGHKLRDAAIAFAALREPELADWIESHVQFPCTMVDSITPASDAKLRGDVEQHIGLRDAWPIKREGFSQWVIEEFKGPRPDWQAAGAQFTDDVGKFEAAKLRLLNAPHSGLAYLGILAGYTTVYEAFGDAAFEQFLTAVTDHEVIPGLDPPQTSAGPVDLTTYRDDIFDRFRIPTIEHRLSQIAWDGSQKLPQRVFGAMRENLANGRPVAGLALIVAGWRRFCAYKVSRGEDIVDPLAASIVASSWVREEDPAEAIEGLLQFDAMVAGDLAASEGFREALIAAEQALRDGDGAAVRTAIRSISPGNIRSSQ